MVITIVDTMLGKIVKVGFIVAEDLTKGIGYAMDTLQGWGA